MKKVVVAVVFAIVMAFLVRQLVVYVPLIRQNRRRIAAAEQFVPVLRKSLRDVRGSSGVEVAWSTSGEGTVYVHGEVSSPNVVYSISNAIVALDPAVPLRVGLTIVDGATQPIEWNWYRERREQE